MRLISAILAAILAASSASAKTYNVDIALSDFDGAGSFYSSGRIFGTIETNGTIGVLDSASITGFNLNTVVDGFGTTSMNSSLGSFTLFGTGLSATANALLFDFSSLASAISFSPNSRSLCGAFFQAQNSCAGGQPGIGGFNEYLDATGSRRVALTFSGATGLQQVATVAAVPLPPSLPVFLIGLAGLGLVARRRRVQ